MKKLLEIVIEDVVIEPNRIQPIIVNFQNGHLKDDEAQKMKCGLYKNEKKQTILAMSNGQVVYKGYRPDVSKELTYTMLAIHNKKNGKVRLIQAERWDVAPVLDQHVDNTSDEGIDKTAELNKQFGSKKIKRRTEQYERMKINLDNIKDQLEKTVSNVEIESTDLELISKDDFEDGLLLPPCNRNVNHESEIYNIHDIVPNNILELLHSEALKLAENKLENKPLFMTETIKLLKSEPQNVHKIAILLYIEAISTWLKIPVKLIKQDNLSVCSYSKEVAGHVVETYSVTSNHRRYRPNMIKDKAIIHCIILGLMLWNFTLDLELFSSMFNFRLGIKKIQDLAKWINTVPLKNNKKKVILKLPLPPPITKPAKIKKNK